MNFLHQLWQQYGPQTPEAYFLSQSMARLILAAFLGGVIGLERELRHRPAGLRTNMFICFGSALFTILSVRLAGEFTGDHTRVAAQIIPGIGFIVQGRLSTRATRLLASRQLQPSLWWPRSAWPVEVGSMRLRCSPPL